MTRKEEINAQIRDLEIKISDYTSQVARLQKELSETPGVLLERDAQAEALAEIERKNDILRKRGYLPATE